MNQTKTQKLPLNANSEQKIISLHLNIDSPGKIIKLQKSNTQNMRELGLRYLPDNKKKADASTQIDFIVGDKQKTPKQSTKQYLPDSFNELPLEKKQSDFLDTDNIGQDMNELNSSQGLQFVPSSDLEEKLTSDIKQFFSQIEQYNLKTKSLFDKLIQQCSKIATETVKGSVVEVFGSFATELCLPNSDIDLVIKIPNSSAFYFPDILRNLETKFSESSFVEETKCLTGASMPVLKVKCTKLYMNKRLDISIQDIKHNGIACVQLVKDYVQLYEPLKPLTLVFKQFLNNCNLADTYQGGLSSYGLILMIVSFLQSKTRGIQASLATLMIEFLQLYGMDLDYAGKTIYAHLPNQIAEFPSIYFDPQNFVFCQQQALVIIDPLNKQNNVGRPTYLVQRLKFAFTNSFINLLNQQNSQTPLKSFFNGAQNVSLALQSQVNGIYKPIYEHLSLIRQIPIIQQNF